MDEMVPIAKAGGLKGREVTTQQGSWRLGVTAYSRRCKSVVIYRASRRKRRGGRIRRLPGASAKAMKHAWRASVIRSSSSSSSFASRTYPQSVPSLAPSLLINFQRTPQ